MQTGVSSLIRHRHERTAWRRWAFTMTFGPRKGGSVKRGWLARPWAIASSASRCRSLAGARNQPG